MHFSFALQPSEIYKIWISPYVQYNLPLDSEMNRSKQTLNTLYTVVCSMALNYVYMILITIRV
jgi:hypothetical protein